MKLYFPSETALDGLLETDLKTAHVLQDELLFTARHAPLIATGLRRILGRDLSRILSLQLLGAAISLMRLHHEPQGPAARPDNQGRWAMA